MIKIMIADDQELIRESLKIIYKRRIQGDCHRRKR